MPADPLRFDEVRAWLFDRALPLWGTQGLDHRHGGSVEVLDWSGKDGTSAFKRTRVQARQIYAFTHVHLLDGAGRGLNAADHCWAFLSANGRRSGGGWARLLGRAGGIVDSTIDALDMAFVLLAMAWRIRAGDRSALAEAHTTLDALDRVLGLGPGLGWRAAEDDPARRLNPHMHLLEAALDLAEASGEQRFADLARDILVLFRDRLFDGELRVLAETFTEDWTPVQGPDRRIEPGHLYEWAWLLHRARPVVELDLSDQALALYTFAERCGLDPRTRLADDGLHGDRMRPSSTFRIWPQTEALKAQLAMLEQQKLNTRGRIGEIVSHLLDHYLAVEPDGAWQDRLGPDYEPLAPNIPASIFYHLVLAFSEYLRLEPLLKRRWIPPRRVRA